MSLTGETKKLSEIQRIVELEEKLESAEEVISFYGNKENWESCCHSSNILMIKNDQEDLGGVLRWVRNTGGKKAREWLLKWNTKKVSE